MNLNYLLKTVPSASVIVWPLKFIVPLFVRLVIVQSPVSVHVLPFSIVTTALLSTAVPPSALSMILIVPVNVLLFVRAKSSVEIVSTTTSPSSVCASAVNSTCAPFAPALPQPRYALLPTTRRSAPLASVFTIVTPERFITLWVLVT